MAQKVYPRTVVVAAMVPGGTPGDLPVIGPGGVLTDGFVTLKHLPKTAKVAVGHPGDALPHPTALVLPAKALVLDCWIDVTVPDTVPGGSTVTVGPVGTPDGWLGNGTTPAPLVAGIQTGNPTLDGTLNWYATNGYGSLLSQFVAGTDADDRGLFNRITDPSSGGLAVAYQASAANNAEFDIYILYMDLT